jgi:hypothetical protein
MHQHKNTIIYMMMQLENYIMMVVTMIVIACGYIVAQKL